MQRSSVLIAIGLLAIASFSRSAHSLYGEHLWYFLAATPTVLSPATYPATLYRVRDLHKLQLARVVSSAAEGSSVVLDSADFGVLSIAHTSQRRTAVSVVHKNSPLTVDDLTVNLSGLTFLPYLTCLEATPPTGVTQLIDLFDPSTSHHILKAAVLLGEVPTGGERIIGAAAPDYTRCNVAGLVGGPEFANVMLCMRQSTTVFLKVGTETVPLTKVPEWFQSAVGTYSISIVAANSRYLILDSNEDGQPEDMPLYVKDAQKQIWRRLRIAGRNSRSRLFGDWLCTIHQWQRPEGRVGSFDQLHTHFNPGRSDERAYATVDLPNVQREYAGFQARDSSIPGDLSLDNLTDGRHIDIKTGEEDSEVLFVGPDNRVLLRVNDSIYEGKIVGSTFTNPSLLVKDQDVPEIHWAFLSDVD